MQIQWYPGHMTKAVRQMKEDMKLIDLVIEICDARIPVSSRNPEIDSLAGGKERIVLFNKEDLADASVTEEWIRYFSEQGLFAAAIDARKKQSLRKVDAVVERATAKKRERDERRGIRPRPVRTMIVGIPNSGKSTFINSYAGKARAKTGNKPGVTKGKQWIRPNKRLELLDTPGILWPKFEDESVGLHLACVGSIRDEIFETTELVIQLMDMVASDYPQALAETYGIDGIDGYDFLKSFAEKFGCLRTGGEADIEKAGAMLLNDFRSGKWGRISLERIENTTGDGKE